MLEQLNRHYISWGTSLSVKGREGPLRMDREAEPSCAEQELAGVREEGEGHPAEEHGGGWGNPGVDGRWSADTLLPPSIFSHIPILFF